MPRSHTHPKLGGQPLRGSHLFGSGVPVDRAPLACVTDPPTLRPWQEGLVRDPLEVRSPHARWAGPTHRRGPGWRAE
jgi:hypothetical protein